jgi:hypothetical protein
MGFSQKCNWGILSVYTSRSEGDFLAKFFYPLYSFFTAAWKLLLLYCTHLWARSASEEEPSGNFKKTARKGRDPL